MSRITESDLDAVRNVLKLNNATALQKVAEEGTLRQKALLSVVVIMAGGDEIAERLQVETALFGKLCYQLTGHPDRWYEGSSIVAASRRMQLHRTERAGRGLTLTSPGALLALLEADDYAARAEELCARAVATVERCDADRAAERDKRRRERERERRLMRKAMEREFPWGLMPPRGLDEARSLIERLKEVCERVDRQL